MYDLLVKNGTVITATMREAMDVAIQDERIVALGAPGELGTDAKRIVDAGDCRKGYLCGIKE